MPALKILRPGLFTTVQDCGRWGFQAVGVPVSGAMDWYAHRLANALVGNSRDAATIEVTLLGPQIEFDGAVTFAITGAEFRVTLDDVAVPQNALLMAGPGSKLRFGNRVCGARAYVAVAGGIDVPLVLRSRATHVVCRMGGHEGRAVRTGDVLPVGGDGRSATDAEHGSGRRRAISGPLPDQGARLRVIPGELVDRITDRRFVISPQSDRMGYRLDGLSASGTPRGEMISSAVPTGAVQVPPTGQPILLMPDHATTGGYAIAATVITADLPLAGQLAPGNWVEFEKCSLDDADAALRAREATLSESLT